MNAPGLVGTLDLVTLSSVLELVARMRRDAFSRNRNFDTFARSAGEGVRARRIWRYLRALEREICAHGPRVGQGVRMQVEPRPEGGRRIVIEVPEVRMRRVAVLDAAEYALLREHAETRDVLDRIEAAGKRG